ncbi:GNAT family N-acetyltransferase [Lentilactobacillus raoultii]|uniref:GNAT family N-acetyltransferase n=1 Tax=Lentilactobacillus raoultii TaxID=1987503 RepID=A0ABW3PLS4_9LACO|nr:GNAT family protein [Lentilactobacillus raoultii]
MMFVFKQFELNQHQVSLLLPEKNQAAALFEAVQADRKELRKWMPWVDDTKSERAEAKFIKYIQGQMVNGKVFMLTIVVDQVPVGMIDFHNIDRANRHAEVGYWLSSQAQGQGVMTRSLEAIIDYGFKTLGLHKILIQVDTENTKSSAIPQRLGFSREAVFKEQIYFHGQFRDFEEFGLVNPVDRH